MSDLLIHSMSEFSDLILDALKLGEAKQIAEIGAEFGGMSFLLAEHAAAEGGTLTSIDPAPKAEFLDWARQNPQVRHIAKTSLEAFDELSGIDAWLVDGDHNWFTVYNELKRIEACCARDGKPMLAFLHDIAWPAARRDMYYAPDQIPEAFRHPHDFDSGAFPGFPALVPNRGFRGMGQFAFALHEGGPRNGVLTAVEDFIEEIRGAGGNIAFAEIPAEWRQPFSYKGGATLDCSTLIGGTGFRGDGNFAWAIEAGGPRNGVLTAVEDFIAEAGAAGRNLAYAHVPAVFGLGILFDADAPWAAQLAQHVAPFHNNPLLASLEENRLRNYLKVIEMQDLGSISRAA